MLGWGLSNSSFRFANSLYEGKEWIYESNFLQSMVRDEKICSNKMWLTLMEGSFLELLVENTFDGFGIRWKR